MVIDRQAPSTFKREGQKPERVSYEQLVERDRLQQEAGKDYAREQRKVRKETTDFVFWRAGHGPEALA